MEDIGRNIRKLRELRKISRLELSERSGISLSHLEKIENGLRSPGMSAYRKIMEILNEEQTIQEKCVAQVQKVILNSSEEQAIYLTKVLEYISENLDMLIT